MTQKALLVRKQGGLLHGTLISSEIAQVSRKGTSQETQETQEQARCGSVVPTPPLGASSV